MLRVKIANTVDMGEVAKTTEIVKTVKIAEIDLEGTVEMIQTVHVN